MSYIWGANTPQEALDRFGYLETHGGPDSSPEDKANFGLFQSLKTILGRKPTADELATTLAIGPSAIPEIKKNQDAADAAAKSVNLDTIQEQLARQQLAQVTTQTKILDAAAANAAIDTMGNYVRPAASSSPNAPAGKPAITLPLLLAAAVGAAWFLFRKR